MCEGAREDDWGKLKQVMKYLKGTERAKITLQADSLNIIKGWVDTTLASHHNCIGQSGGMISLGAGAVISKSTKQRINGKISTDSEIIAVNDFMGEVLNTLYFMGAQGYNMAHNIMFQDNQSNTRRMLNGKRSSTKQTKHMNVKYFFMTDVIKRGDMSVENCLTGDMGAAVLTNPL